MTLDLFGLPVTALSNIGPKYKKLLENLDIYTVLDLVYHIPFRYDDYSQTKMISELQNGETVTIRAVIGSVDNIFTRYGKKITKAFATDESGKVTLLWFNQHYIKKTIEVGEIYKISGRVSLFDKKITLIAPKLELEKANTLNTGRLVPIYRETMGVSSKWLRARINDVVSKIDNLQDTFSTEFKIKNHLADLAWAIKKIHFPEDMSEVTSARHRLAFEELFYDLLQIEKRKKDWHNLKNSHIYKPFTAQMSKFVSKLPFELTESQKNAVSEITTDLEQKHPMNRLLEGDVGTGKTIVAVIAAYLGYLNGFRTVYLAPTEILAQQHYDTFNKLLSPFKIGIALQTGNSKSSQIEGDVIIGTHALLYTDKQYEKVGLVVIDEQHRFGVQQRAKLQEMTEDRENFITPNLLTMSATPIPRTLALTIYGDLSISTLKTHPNNKRNVATKIISENNRDKTYDWILQHKLSTFIVCPFIEESEVDSLANVKAAESEFEKLKKGPFKHTQLGLIHGRMKPEEKQSVISKFRIGEIKILVATPVIEVGIDIPDASVIIIEGAERYGLASLHQLRGRVGRNSENGYCFVFMSAYSPKAYTRLKNLEQIDDGLKLAEIDMKMRGQGDIFSTMQHGFKNYKIATLDNFSLLEQAKQAAQEVYNNIDGYPAIKTKLTTFTQEFVRNN